MTHTTRVTVFKCFCYLNSDVYDFTQRECGIAVEPPQIGPFNDRHNEEERTFVFAVIEDRHHCRMVHLSDQLCFSLKALFSLRIEKCRRDELDGDRKSTRLNSSHGYISYAVFCL